MRDPIMIGEKNADALEKKDKAHSEKIFNDMPSDMQYAIEKLFAEKYQDHLIFLKVKNDYYAMIDVSGTLCKINKEDFSLTELFSMKKYACNINVKDNNLYFLTGKRESRKKRNLASRLIHPSQIVVLTDIQKWEYSFETNQIELK